MKRRAFTLVELMVVISIIALLMGLLLPALSSAMRSAKSKKEMVQLRGLHQTMAVYGSESNGKFPIPGDVRRKHINGQYIPGAGQKNPLYNSTDNIASLLIAMKYAQPEIFVSPAENNATIGVKGKISESSTGQPEPYDYTSYQPHNGTCYDENFNTRLGDEEMDHCSFSNLTLLGPNRRGRWHDTAGGDTICWSTRGTINGDTQHEEYITNPVLLQHGSDAQWIGHFNTADGAVLVAKNFYPDVARYDTQPLGLPGYKRDNMHNCEFNSNLDGIHGDEEAMKQGDIYMSYSWLMAPNDDSWAMMRTFDEAVE